MMELSFVLFEKRQFSIVGFQLFVDRRIYFESYVVRQILNELKWRSMFVSGREDSG